MHFLSLMDFSVCAALELALRFLACTKKRLALAAARWHPEVRRAVRKGFQREPLVSD